MARKGKPRSRPKIDPAEIGKFSELVSQLARQSESKSVLPSVPIRGKETTQFRLVALELIVGVLAETERDHIAALAKEKVDRSELTEDQKRQIKLHIERVLEKE